MNPQTLPTQSLEGPVVQPGSSLEGYNEGEAPPETPVQDFSAYKPPKTLAQRLALPLTIVVILFIIGSIAYILFSSTRQMTPAEESKFNQQAVDLSQIDTPTISNKTSGQLAVNGGLSVSGSFQVVPKEKPTNPNTGQIYYDKERNALGYYNGTEFVYMQGNSPPPTKPVQTAAPSVSNTTIINNATQLAPPSVQLQQSTETSPQLGNFNVDGTGKITNLTSNSASFNNGDIATLSSNTATITNGTVDTLTSTTGTITTLNSDNATITNGSISQLSSDQAAINVGAISNLSSNTATITNGNVTNLTSNSAAITAGNINNLTSTTATLGTANITTGNVTTDNITTANVTTGNIATGNITVGNITTANIGLTNTTQIDSGGSTFAVNKFAELPSGLPVTAGDNSIGASTIDTGFSKYATKITTGSTGGPLQSVSVYIKTAPIWGTYSFSTGWSYSANPLVVSLYTDDGNFPSQPNSLLWTTTVDPANITNNSWLTVNTDHIPLQSGTSYWVSVRSPGDPYFLYYSDSFVTTTSNKIKDNNTCYNTAAGNTSTFGTCTLSNAIMNMTLNYTSDPSTGGAGAMLSLTNTGQTAFRNTADSPNAFRIQNASGSTIFNVDTYYGHIAVGKASADYTLDVGGDLNLSNNAPLRFGGRAAVNGNSTTTTISGTNINVQGGTGTFAVQNAAGTSNYLTVNTSTGATTLAGATTFSSTTAHTGAATFSSTATVTGATTLNGATTINNTLLNKVASTTAFQIQNASSVNLFVADTTNMTISVKGTDTTFGNLTLTDAHFKSTQTTAPTIGTPTNCGTTPTAAITAGSTDSAGSFTITTGTGGTSSTCDTVLTFRRAYGAAPKSIIVVGKSTVGSAQRQIYVVSSTTTTFNVSFATSTGGADSTAYQFNYWIIE